MQTPHLLRERRSESSPWAKAGPPFSPPSLSFPPPAPGPTLPFPRAFRGLSLRTNDIGSPAVEGQNILLRTQIMSVHCNSIRCSLQRPAPGGPPLLSLLRRARTRDTGRPSGGWRRRREKYEGGGEVIMKRFSNPSSS